MNACTIIAKNYVAFARVLARSLREHHADARLTVLVVDDFEGHIDPAQEPFDVLSPADIDLPEFPQMAGYYEILELTTAVKPWLLRRLLRGEDDHVVYLDPDIRFYASCPELVALAREHGVVLTPHNVSPMPRDGRKPSEQDILIAGAYNLGFIALRRDEATDRLLDWWSERLLTQCTVDPERGLFVDQRWIDFLPGMMPDHHILRDPAYNVAYWNLATRELTRAGDGDGSCLVDGSPLRFFHFSGFDPRTPGILSKHQDRIDLDVLPVARDLCAGYAAELLEQGYADSITWPYTYTCDGRGRKLDRTARRLYLRALEDHAIEGSLFDAQGADAFAAYASEPAGAGADPRISRYLAAVREERPDLAAAFPTLTGRNAEGFLEWAALIGPEQLGDLFAWTGVTPLPAGAEVTTEPAPLSLVPRGVNLAGYLRAELGVGEVARQVTAALDEVGEPVLPLVQVASASRQGHAFQGAATAHNPFPVNLLCINADQTPAFAAAVGPGFFDRRHTIGWWWWEVSTFPEMWDTSFEHVDEIWAGSRFVAESLQAVAPVPVLRMPLPVAAPVASDVGRADLGLPEDAHLFLFAFDYHSVFERKNPVGAVEAFKRAFAPGEGPVLVLKSINGDVHQGHRGRLYEAIGDRPDIVVIDRYLEAAEKDALVTLCDTYVSLHRSEGFGITIAEAMALGKPAIATRYSGNLDFMTEDNSFLVDAELTPIGPGNDPYPPDGTWAEPDLEHAASLMRAVVADPEEAARRGARAAAHLAEHHSHHAAGEAMQLRLDEIRRRMDWTVRAEYADQAQEETLSIIDQGIPRSRLRRADPRRWLRSLAVRAGRPVLAHEATVHRALLFSLLETQRALEQEQRLSAARVEADALAQRRRLERLDGRVEALSVFSQAASAHLDGLQAAADDQGRRLDDLERLGRSATAHLDGLQRFADRVEGAGGAARPAGTPAERR